MSNALSDRAIIRLSADAEGEDAAMFLQGLVTNDVTGELPVYAGLLTPQGKTLFDFIMWPSANGALLLDCERSVADDLIKRLSLYRLRRKIVIERAAELGVFWSPEMGENATHDPRLAGLGQRWIGPVEGADGAEVGADARWLAHRLSLGVAEGQAELGDVLWLETNAVDLNGVSFTKGCYVGQENTARMNWRQKVNRRLVIVPLDRSEEKRRRAAYPEIGLAVDHLRVEAIPPDLAPEWMSLEAARSPSDQG